MVQDFVNEVYQSRVTTILVQICIFIIRMQMLFFPKEWFKHQLLVKNQWPYHHMFFHHKHGVKLFQTNMLLTSTKELSDSEPSVDLELMLSQQQREERLRRKQCLGFIKLEVA